MVGDSPSANIGHTIERPARVRVSEWNDGASASVEIEQDAGPVTRLRVGPAEEVLPQLWRTGACEAVPLRFIAKSGAAMDVELSGYLSAEDSVDYFAMLKQQLQSAGVPDVTQVWSHEIGASRMLIDSTLRSLRPHISAAHSSKENPISVDAIRMGLRKLLSMTCSNVP